MRVEIDFVALTNCWIEFDSVYFLPVVPHKAVVEVLKIGNL